MHPMFERTLDDDLTEMGFVIMSGHGPQSLFEADLDFNVYILIGHAPCTIHDLARYTSAILKRHVYLQHIAISIYRLNDCFKDNIQRICYDRVSSLYSHINHRG